MKINPLEICFLLVKFKKRFVFSFYKTNMLKEKSYILKSTQKYSSLIDGLIEESFNKVYKRLLLYFCLLKIDLTFRKLLNGIMIGDMQVI